MTATDGPASPSSRPHRGVGRADVAERTRSFTGLSVSVRASGLYDRPGWFHLALFGGLVVALGGVIAGFVLLRDPWFQLLIAAALGVLFTQFAFLGHEASHRQVLAFGAGQRPPRTAATRVAKRDVCQQRSRVGARDDGGRVGETSGREPWITTAGVPSRPTDISARGLG